MVTRKQCRTVTNPVVQTYNTQVPETETRECTRTVCKCIDGEMVQVEEPVTYDVTVLRPQVATRNCTQKDVVFETKSDVISYCVKTPKKRTVPCAEETVYKLEPVEKTRTVSVCVPVKTAKPVEVTVCRMVPRTICCCQDCARSLRHAEATQKVKDRIGHAAKGRLAKVGKKCAKVGKKCAKVTQKCADVRQKCGKLLGKLRK